MPSSLLHIIVLFVLDMHMPPSMAGRTSMWLDMSKDFLVKRTYFRHGSVSSPGGMKNETPLPALLTIETC